MQALNHEISILNEKFDPNNKALRKWKENETALLLKMSNDEIKAYAAVKSSSNQAEFIIATRQLLALLKDRPYFASQVKDHLLQLANISKERAELIKKLKYYEDLSKIYIEAGEEYKYNQMLNELRSIRSAIENR